MPPLYRILVLATRHAVPPDSGYATSVFGAVAQLSKQGIDVRVLLVDDGKSQGSGYPANLLAGVVRLSRWQRIAAAVQALATHRAYTACKWAVPEVVDVACRLRATWPFDILHVCGAFHMDNALAIRRRCGVKVVFRAENVEHAICQRMANRLPRGIRRMVWQREAAMLRKQEAAWCQAADLCLPISDEDRTILQALAPRTRMVTIQVGSSLADERAQPVPLPFPPSYLHVGSLAWPPRLEGFLWFLHEVWPKARAAIPGARLFVAGALPEALRRQLEPWRSHGVELFGFVEDLEALARTCAAVVVPMNWGGGIKIRVLTAWANGWPVLGTTCMGEGLPAQDGVNCLMADDPSELVSAMQVIAVDAELRALLVRNGRDTIRRYFSWEAIGKSIQQAHESILGAP
jgi:glycosyltransferase involved in cell wall biosynthesis